MNPEEKARTEIDRQLFECGWHVQDHAAMNLSAGLGIAVREFPLRSGFTDYLLYVDGKAVGVVEAKPEGHTLTAVETQSAKYADGLRAGQPIQSVKEIESKLRIIGVTGFWGDAAGSMGVDPPILKRWLGEIGRRRNQIVHEGDRRRLANGRLSKVRDIERDQVDDDIHVIDCFVYAMDHEIESKATA